MREKMKSIIRKLPVVKTFFYQWSALKKDVQVLSKQQKAADKEMKMLREMEQQIKTLSTEINRLQADFSLMHNKLKLWESPTDAQCFPDNPLVSVIILNRNGKHHLEVLMQSFHCSVFYKNIEIICVDNGSTDDSLDYLETWKNEFHIKIVRNMDNKTFSEANNIGVKHAEGKYLLFLNNDTEVTDGWLDELLKVMQTRENPGAIGAKLIYPQIPEHTTNEGKSFTIQHAGIAFRDDIRQKQYFIRPYNLRKGEPLSVYETQTEERICVTAAVLMVSKDIFEQVGGFDENYVYGYEDVDFCLKLKAAGYINYYCPTCLVYHYEFGTQKEDNAQEVTSRRLHNMVVFKEKWQSFLAEKLLEDKIQKFHLYTEAPLEITILASAPDPNPDIMDKRIDEFMEQLRNMGYTVKFEINQNADATYSADIETDILILADDSCDPSKINSKKQLLFVITPQTNAFQKWFESRLASGTCDSHFQESCLKLNESCQLFFKSTSCLQ